MLCADPLSRVCEANRELAVGELNSSLRRVGLIKNLNHVSPGRALRPFGQKVLYVSKQE